MARLMALLLLLPSLAFAQKPTRYAVIVGVGHYDHNKLPRLQFTQNDATELAKLLKQGGYEVELLCDTDNKKETKKSKARVPTKANIEAKLELVLNKCKREDLVLVAFAGHGLQFDDDPDCYFCPTDAKPFKDETKTLISLDGLYRRFDKCNASAKVLLADCCRNDPEGSRGVKRSLPNDLLDRTPPKGIYACFSCERGQSAYEHKDLGIGHGVFFYHFLEGLRGKAGRDEEGIAFLDLISYVNKQVPKTVRSKIGQGAVQTPNLKLPNISGQLFLLDKAVALPTIVDPKPGEEREFEIFKGVKMKFCWIPSGDAQLGSPKEEQDYVTKTFLDGKRPEFLDSETETARGLFKTKGFWLGKYEVTQEQYTGVMAENPSTFKGAKLPVETVSWEDCQKFIAKCEVKGLKAKLPHEDEWEYACRGGTSNKQAFYFGNVLNGDKANCNGTFPYGTETEGANKKETTQVGSYEKVAPHPWGLCDMHGNVWEFCENLYSATGSVRTVRGGCWYDGSWGCRSADRDGFEPTARDNALGFRLALVP